MEAQNLVPPTRHQRPRSRQEETDEGPEAQVSGDCRPCVDADMDADARGGTGG